MRRALWLSIVALAGCPGDDADDVTDDSEDTEVSDTDDTEVGETDVTAYTGVITDCEEVVGNICPFAGSSRNGWNGDGHDRLETWFSLPMSITFSPYGNPIIADWNNHKLRMLKDDGTLETIMGTAFLGDGDPNLLDSTPAGAPGTDVNLNHPTEQRYLPDGRLMSASWHTHKLRIWDPVTKIVHVWLGSGAGFDEPVDGVPGTEYPATQCQLNQPRWVEIDSEGSVWILDQRNERLRVVTTDDDMVPQTVRTVAGSGVKAVVGTAACNGDDPDTTDALATCFNFPKGGNPEPGGSFQIDEANGMVYIADIESHVIRALDIDDGTVTTLAGSPGEAGDVDGTGTEARLNYPAAVALDREAQLLFVADTNNHKVKVIDLATKEVSTFAGTGEPTCAGDPGTLQVCDEQFRAGDGGPATEATLFRPFGVDLDLDGNVVISDTYNHRFRIVYR